MIWQISHTDALNTNWNGEIFNNKYHIFAKVFFSIFQNFLDVFSGESKLLATISVRLNSVEDVYVYC